MKFCFIGSGMLARRVAGQLLKSGRHEIASVWSRNPKTAKEFAEKFGAKQCDSLEQAITSPEVEGVYIVTPHSAHYEHVKRALLLNKPVLCEKAFTINALQSEKLAELAKKQNTLLCEAMWTWFNPNIQKALEIVKNGELGKVKSISAKLCFSDKFRAIFEKRPRFYDLNYGAGSLLDVGVYPIAFSYLFLGMPESISCEMKMWHGFDEYDKMVMSYSGGAKCHLAASYRKIESETAVIEMEKGKVIVPFFHKARKVKVKSASSTKVYSSPGGYVHEFDQFEKDYRAGRTESSIISLSQTIDIMKLMDECRRQNDFVYPEQIEKVD